jgi:hypothetical protein
LSGIGREPRRGLRIRGAHVCAGEGARTGTGTFEHLESKSDDLLRHPTVAAWHQQESRGTVAYCQILVSREAQSTEPKESHFLSSFEFVFDERRRFAMYP